MSQPVLVAGVDTSTQSCKVRVTDSTTGQEVRLGTAPHPDGTHVNPEAWWTAFRQAAQKAGGLDDVAALSVGGQQHGMVLLDDHGRVIRDALLWNDQRSAPQAQKLTEKLGLHEWVHRVGTPLIASITITKVAWVAENEPENARKIAAICLPHDWLTWRIAGYGPCESAEEGKKALAHLYTDRSDASGTGYFNPVTNQYDRECLQLALGSTNDANSIILPHVLSPRETCEKADPQIAGSAVAGGCLLGPGGGDNATASFGLSMKPGDVSISLGTSGVAAAISESEAYDETGAINGFADLTGHFIPLACTINASRLTDAGCHMLGTSYDEFADLAFKSVPGAHGVTLIPFFDGERTPNRPTASARLEGMTLENTTRENVARAFVEALLCSQRDCLEDLRHLGVPIRRLLLIGGGAKSPAVRRLGPSIWGMKIDVPHTDEYVAIGAARQAAWVLSDKDEAPAWKINIDETYSATTDEMAEGQRVYEQYDRHRG
jgi:xylulokinase